MKRITALPLLTALAGSCIAQTWTKAYDDGLTAAKTGDWASARTDFQQANAARPGDTTTPTGVWRNGSPYSPNFMSAYCGLKEALSLSGDARKSLLDQVAPEFERLLDRREYCPETFFFLDEAYVLLGQADKRVTLGQLCNLVSKKANWRVDTEAVAPDDLELLAQVSPSTKAATPKPASFNSTQETPQTTPKTDKTESISVPEQQRETSAAKTQDPAGSSEIPTKDSGATGPNSGSLAVDLDPGAPQVPAIPSLPTVSDPVTIPAQPSSPAPVQPSVPSVPPTDQGPTATSQTSDNVKAPRPNRGARVQNGKAGSALVKPVKPKEAAKTSGKTKKPEGPEAVPTLSDKFAIIIGNSESKMDGCSIPFATDDAQMLRQTLIATCGYPDSNVEVVLNATAAQMAASINAMASRVPDKAAVLIYFTGVGENIDGKDYLAGVDSDASNDSSTMILKDDIYKAFMVRGARIFAFYQSNRPIVEGRYFGAEVPVVGSISQMQATLPGQNVYAIESAGKEVGLFTNSFVSVLQEIRSNQTPILDFGWQVFYRLRRGDTGLSGGSSNQSPSLPVLTNMASDARF